MKRRRDDEGASLVLALVFLLVVGLFVGAALRKSESVSASGQQVRVRGQLQYALDGGVDRALQVLRDDLSGGSPSRCVAAPELETDITSFGDSASGLSLNGHNVSYSCQTLAGRAATTGDTTNTNFALLVTSPNDGALTTQSGTSNDLVVAGSVYLNGKVTNDDIKKKIEVSTGDIVAPSSRSGCAADLAALTDVSLTGTGQLKACTDQTLAQALPSLTLPPAPTVNVSTLLGSGVSVNLGGGKKCQVFLPGLYTSEPALSTSDPNYFVSGLYYFANTGQWQIDGGAEVTAGQRSVSTDSSVPSGDCSTMTDTAAIAALPGALSSLVTSIAPYRFSYGATWVFGGNSSLDFKNGTVTMFTPPSDTSGANLVGASSTTGGGYAAITTGAGLLTGGSNNSTMRMNAKVYAPTGAVSIFATNSTEAAARGGVIAYTVELQASSAAGPDALAISAPGGTSNPPPPYRTVRVVTRDMGGTSATNTAVATISNYSPYAVSVKSWRTG